MKPVITFILLTVYFCGTAQVSTEPEPYAESISSSDLRKHLAIIASAEMQGRETATEGQKRAAAYIEQQFSRLRLRPGWNMSYQQPFRCSGIP